MYIDYHPVELMAAASVVILIIAVGGAHDTKRAITVLLF
jgi:hypothetical protein